MDACLGCRSGGNDSTYSRPARPAGRRAKLRQGYVVALNRYESVPYVWGGEGLRGIDCSGLVRRGMIDADLKTGFATANPALIRAGCDLWWHDCSAKALKEEYRHQTQLLLTTSSLNHLNYAALLPGDFAVTDSGVHTLAYIGNQTWLEADPGAWKVIKVKIPSKIAWFSQPMHIMRWRQLATP
ncbi:MAG: C40 family peptidase [Abitibacteriaceae bacterium]|nr:C40 family peptidase [Abditibacteriaceae bacterium]